MTKAFQEKDKFGSDRTIVPFNKASSKRWSSILETLCDDHFDARPWLYGVYGDTASRVVELQSVGTN